MRNQLLLIFLFWAYFSSECSAQMYLTTVVHNGKTYKVYPARLKNNTFGYPGLNIDSRDFVEDLPIVAYNPFELPDGNYIAYYERSMHKKRNSRVYYITHKDTTKIALIFNLKNNKLQGECLVHNHYNQKLIAKTYYLDGKCDSTWFLYNSAYKNHQTKVHFKNGRLNGPAIEYYKTKIVATGTFINDQLHGEYITYRKNKIKEKTTYHFSKRDQIEYFTSKGFVYYYQNFNSTSEFRIKEYDKKTKQLLLIETNLNKIDSSYTIKAWYPNGKPKIDASYSAKANNYVINKYLDLLNVESNINQLVTYKSWHKKGEVELDFDLSKKEMTGKIIAYDKNKNIIEFLEWNSLLNHPKIIELSITRYSTKRSKVITSNYRKYTYLVNYYHGKNPGYKAQFINNQLDYLKIDPNYLHLLYPDSIGLFLSNIEKTKKHTYYTYNLLHSDYSFFKIENHKKGLSNENISWNNLISSNKDTLSHIEQTISTNDKKIKLVYTFDIPYKKGKFTYNTNIVKGLFYPTDSLNFKVYYEERPWNRKVKIKSKNLDKNETIRGKLKFYGSKKQDKTYLEITENSYSFWRRNNEKDNYFYRDDYFNCSKGYPNGKYTWDNIECYYYNHKLNGPYKSSPLTGYYDNGQKDGLFINSYSIINYNKNAINGKSLFLDSYNSQIELETTFKNDTVNGEYLRFGLPHQILEKTNFVDGVPNGHYTRGLVNKPVYISARFENGYLVDTAFYYFRDAGLKSIVVYNRLDSICYNNIDLKKLRYYRADDFDVIGSYVTENRFDQISESLKVYKFHNSIPLKMNSFVLRNKFSDKYLVEFNPNLNGKYTHYYKNGVTAQIGEVADNKRVGNWTMWDLNGVLFKEIDYTQGIFIRPNSNDTVYYYGKIKMYYPNGKLLLEGLILEQDFAYKCDQDMEVAFEDIYYLSFFDKDGNQTLNEKGGIVYEFHNNGIVRLKGNFLNGQRHGLWEYFNPDGKLEERGKYEFGKQEGIWYSGDLEGIAYEDNMCSANFSENIKMTNSNIVRNDIKIKQITYKKGRLLESYSLQLVPLF